MLSLSISFQECEMNFMPEAIVRRRYASGYLLVNYAEMEIIGN